MDKPRATKIESLLMEANLVDEKTLSEALVRHKAHNTPLLELLVERQQVDEAALVSAISESLGRPALGKQDVKISENVKETIPKTIIQKFGVIPLQFENDSLVIAVSNPFELDVFDEISVRCQKRVRVELAPPTVIRGALQDAEMDNDPFEDLLKNVPDTDVEFIISEQQQLNPTTALESSKSSSVLLESDTNSAPITKLVNFIFLNGIQQKASDIHIEPEKLHSRIRFRVDGDLREIMVIPPEVHSRVVARIKIMAAMDIIETRRPLDGSSKVTISDRDYDLRVSTIPSYFGEKAVIRILDSNKSFELSSLGLTGPAGEAWLRLLRQPNGLLLLTGPTGSGKTTTLYASVLELRHPTRNVVTVEDPVEYQLAGVVHVPVHAEIGMTFGSALRAILRQDPDVVLLGEIRDSETAEIAVKAAQTGHLLLSTLHTNTAIGAIPRLMDLGISPYVLSTVLLGVMAQRLIRTLCPKCKTPHTYDPRQLALIAEDVSQLDFSKTMKGEGCNHCMGTGFSGRQAIVELVQMTSGFRQKLAEGATEQELFAQAKSDGTQSLVEAGLESVLAGNSAPSEVSRFATVDLKPMSVAPDHGEQMASTAVPEPPPKESGAFACCTDCGVEISLDWRNCPHCGSMLAREERPRSAVVCDDDPVTRKIITRLLRNEFDDIREATNGREALDLISDSLPDILIIDHHMPEMTGIEVVQDLRKRLAVLSLSIIVLTFDHEADLEIEALNAGANDFVRKPIEAKKFRARVNTAMRSRESRLAIGG